MSAQLTNYFKNCLYFTSGNLYRQIDRLAYEAFSPINITPSQAFLLMAIKEHGEGDCHAASLVLVMGLEKSTLSRLLNDLHKKRVIKKKKCGKIIFITLSSEGELLIPKIHKSWKRLYERYVELWGEEESNALNKAILEVIS